jgi:signal transduction histidine kinase
MLGYPATNVFPYVLTLFIPLVFSLKILTVKYRGVVKQLLQTLAILGFLTPSLFVIFWGFNMYRELLPLLFLSYFFAFSYPFVQKKVEDLGYPFLLWPMKIIEIFFSTLFFLTIFVSLIYGENLLISNEIFVLIFLFSVAIFYFLYKYESKKDAHERGVFSYLENKIACELELGKIGFLVSQYIKSALGVENILLFVFDEHRTNFKYKMGEKSFKAVKGLDMKMLLDVVYFCQDHENNEILKIEDLREVCDKVEGKIKEQVLEVMKFMEEDCVKIVIPLNRRLVIDGVILVGEREQGEPFVFEDFKILNRVVQIASVAFGRAILYQEVEELSENLQRRVGEKTKKLKYKIEKMEDMMRRERDLIDIMGHELRTPLTIAKNAIEVIEDQKDQWDDELEEHFGYLKSAIRREMAIVEMLLAATKLDSGRMESNFEKVSLTEVVKNLKLAFEKEASVKGLKFEVDIDEGKEWYVKADSLRFQQILDNLVGNAVKYTRKGYVKIVIEDLDSEIGIFVKDSGEGLEQQDLERLGEKFYRAEQYIGGEASKNNIVRPGGAGLGLYVAFGLVSLMNGRYEVESKKGKGSTFKVFFEKYKD